MSSQNYFAVVARLLFRFTNNRPLPRLRTLVWLTAMPILLLGVVSSAAADNVTQLILSSTFDIPIASAPIVNYGGSGPYDFALQITTDSPGITVQINAPHTDLPASIQMPADTQELIVQGHTLPVAMDTTSLITASTATSSLSVSMAVTGAKLIDLQVSADAVWIG